MGCWASLEAAQKGGSFIELTWNGRDPLQGRTFPEDRDVATISATTVTGQYLGAVTGRITPA